MKKSEIYNDKIRKITSDILYDIKTAIGNARGGFIAFPTSDKEEEDKVYVDAYVDSSGMAEPCVVGSLEFKSGEYYVNLWQDYVGGWSVALSEFPITALLTILSFVEQEGYVID